jgi:prolyl 4-hydroxylase
MGWNIINKMFLANMKTSPQGYLQLNEFPNVKQVHNDPPIFLVENFLSPAECEKIIKMSENNVKVSHVVDKVTGQGVTHPSRTSQSCYYGYDIKWLVSRVHRLTGVGQKFQEPIQVARYLTGQFYQSHLDALDTDDVKEKGQRIGTVLIYLNDVKTGGATFFNHLNFRVQPKQGAAVVFFPSKMDGTILDNMLHTAEDASDTKWVSQIWLRNKQYSN